MKKWYFPMEIDTTAEVFTMAVYFKEKSVKSAQQSLDFVSSPTVMIPISKELYFKLIS